MTTTPHAPVATITGATTSTDTTSTDTAPTTTRPVSSAYRRGAALDAQVRAIARDAVSGARDERKARWDIAALVVQSGLASMHTQRWKKQGDTRQFRQDLGDHLEELLITKIVGNDDSPAVLDLQHLAGTGSMSGWVSKFSQGSLLSLQRNVLRARERVGYAMSPVPDAAGASGAGASTQDTRNSELEQTAERQGARATDDLLGEALDARVVAEEAIARHAARAKQARETKLVHVNARSLCDGFGIPAPERVENDAEATRLRSLLSQDDKAAHKVVSLLLNPFADADEADEALMRMWEDHPRRVLEKLAATDPMVAHTISMAAVMPLPRLDTKLLRQLRDDCQGVLGSTKGSKILNQVVTAWGESRATMKQSEYYNGLSNPLAADNLKAAHERAADHTAFVNAVEALLAAGVTVFGATVADVEEFISSRYALVEEELVDRLAS